MNDKDFNASLKVDLPTLKTLQRSASEGSFSPGFQRLASSSDASCRATCSLSVVRETGFSVEVVLFTGFTPEEDRASFAPGSTPHVGTYIRIADKFIIDTYYQGSSSSKRKRFAGKSYGQMNPESRLSLSTYP
jgi:hypothetical protein